MRIDVLTIFPGMFESVLGESMLKRAQQKGLLRVALTDMRDFSIDPHRKVDDRPYGGGPGMVLKVEPVAAAVRAVRASIPKCPGRLLLMCPRGRPFNQALAHELALQERLVIIAGHYEGYDERIVDLLQPELVSIGDYVLTGGELPAMVVIDAVVRLLPGVLGDESSVESESFAPAIEGGLEYPQYTRPAEFEGHAVPDVLLSGNHAEIGAWQQKQARIKTQQQRPDLLKPGKKPAKKKK